MTSPAPLRTQPVARVAANPLFRFAAVFGLLYAFLVGVNGLGEAFKDLGSGLTDPLFALTDNPFMGLVVGILTTTLVQSSSVTTALVVGLVAAPENPLPVANAVPIIMGANIGTTVTNSIVALAHMNRREEFRRAFSVATCHDFFNFITVGILLPLELLTGYLRSTATFLASALGSVGGVQYDSPIKGAIKAGVVPVESGIVALVEDPGTQAIALIGFSGLLIFVTLMLLVRVMRATMQSRVESVVSRAFGLPVWMALLVGVVATVMVQSSSITTSLLVPLAGAGLLTLPQAFPITLGANIGTTVTALLAALAATGANAEAGLTIALVHLLFNLTGTAMILPWAPIRRVPLGLAQRMANVAIESRTLALVYVAGLFYGLPVLLAALGQLWQ
jgi:sodium-dependent phosphate cotransporter